MIRPSTLTLFTDASFCACCGAAGWGAWAIRSDWRTGTTIGGEIKTALKGSSEAEVCAIANALFVLNESGQLADHVEVMIQSDSLHALGVIRACFPEAQISNHADGAAIPATSNRKPTEVENRALIVIRNITIQTGMGMSLRHVRGHQSGSNRDWVNRQCDRTARAYMTKSRLRMQCKGVSA